jgi:hypothetical protein
VAGSFGVKEQGSHEVWEFFSDFWWIFVVFGVVRT